MTPIVNGLEEEFAGRAEVVSLNAGQPEVMRLQTEYVLRGHPTIAILDADANVVERFTGPQPAETLRAALEQVAP